MKRRGAIYSVRWLNRCYLKKSAEGKSANYNISYIFYITFLNNKKCVLLLLNLGVLNKKTIKKYSSYQ